MPPREKTGVPLHFSSSTIPGSATRMSLRTFASILPRQSPSSLIFSSIRLEADFDVSVGFTDSASWCRYEARSIPHSFTNQDPSPISSHPCDRGVQGLAARQRDLGAGFRDVAH